MPACSISTSDPSSISIFRSKLLPIFRPEHGDRQTLTYSPWKKKKNEKKKIPRRYNIIPEPGCPNKEIETLLTQDHGEKYYRLCLASKTMMGRVLVVRKSDQARFGVLSPSNFSNNVNDNSR